jgi:hypothetical protein
MFPDGETGARVVGNQSLLRTHLFQRQRLRFISQQFALLSKKRTFQPAGTFHLPKSIPAMFDSVEIVERANAGKQREFFAIESRHARH